MTVQEFEALTIAKQYSLTKGLMTVADIDDERRVMICGYHAGTKTLIGSVIHGYPHGWDRHHDDERIVKKYDIGTGYLWILDTTDLVNQLNDTKQS